MTSLYYHFAILLLFRPLIKLRILGSKVSPRDVCQQAADAIQSLLRSYAQLYTLRRTPSFVPYFVLTSAIVHLAIGAADKTRAEGGDPNINKMEPAAQIDPRIAQSLAQAISDLAEMAPCHNFAEQALNILRFLAKKWKIDINVDGVKPLPQDYDKLVKPYTSSLNFFAPNVRQADSVCDWGMGRSPTEEGVTRQAASTIENPLLWPFPMQARPLMPQGKEMEDAGFAVI